MSETITPGEAEREANYLRAEVERLEALMALVPPLRAVALDREWADGRFRFTATLLPDGPSGHGPNEAAAVGNLVGQFPRLCGLNIVRRSS